MAIMKAFEAHNTKGDATSGRSGVVPASFGIFKWLEHPRAPLGFQKPWTASAFGQREWSMNIIPWKDGLMINPCPRGSEEVSLSSVHGVKTLRSG
uniref:Transposase n=1 Tax=Steinernema glaseri TaxID=37863 RepID=A0A1I7ZVJ3_9BILA